MGLDKDGIRFLLGAHRQGIDFSRTAMIGRQEMNLSLDELEKSLTDFGYPMGTVLARQLACMNDKYAENFLRIVLEAKEIASFDASDFEGATHVHDFNLPIYECQYDRYSVVLDGGTLEHVFNFPQAIKNCMQMVAPGGHFLGIMPTNNYSGHGFYQFSPELLFRVFSAENGFVCSIRTAIVGMDEWVQVSDPQITGRRELVNSMLQTLLLVTAQKKQTVPLFAKPVQQSDYAALWEKNGPR